MTITVKLVYEIVAQYGAFRKLHIDLRMNFGSQLVVAEVYRLFGIPKVRTTQSNWLIERSFRTFSCCLKAGDMKRIGRVGASHRDELPGYVASEHRGDAQRDEVEVLTRWRC